MQETSELYKDILAGDHRAEFRLSIGDIGRLITKRGERITFGGTSILVGASGADAGYDESTLMSMATDLRVFSKDTPAVGACVAGEIDVKMLVPSGEIVRQARMVPYVRLVDDNGRKSEWLQQGVFYVDTRAKDDTGEEVKWITLHGFDDMLKAQADYPPSTLQWPAKDIDVVREIASSMGVSVDSRTAEIMTRGYLVQYPGQYCQKEVLGFIAAMYGGCFIMSPIGELRLVQIHKLPRENRYLVVGGADRRAITFGGERILV